MGRFIQLTGVAGDDCMRVSISNMLFYTKSKEVDIAGTAIDMGKGDVFLFVRETPEEIDALIEQAERS